MCVYAGQKKGCKLILENPHGGILVKPQASQLRVGTEGRLQAWPVQRNLLPLVPPPAPLGAGADFCASPSPQIQIFPAPSPWPCSGCPQPGAMALTLGLLLALLGCARSCPGGGLGRVEESLCPGISRGRSCSPQPSQHMLGPAPGGLVHVHPPHRVPPWSRGHSQSF